jgi:hypothetical protein
MFMFDIETLGIESTSVILSLSCIYFRSEDKPTYQQLKQDAFFVKFDAKDQATRLNRKIDKGTLEWWNKQCDMVKDVSYKPTKDDYKLEDGLKLFHDWVKTKNDDECWIWARGSLDQVILQSCERAVGLETIFPHNQWRDVRTAIDLLYGAVNGYCDVDHPDFLYDRDVYKHNPIDDCALDIMMLIYGKEKTPAA